jgi:hypothetical protein
MFILFAAVIFPCCLDKNCISQHTLINLVFFFFLAEPGVWGDAMLVQATHVVLNPGLLVKHINLLAIAVVKRISSLL